MFAFPLDQMVGGIFYEHSHRMIASFVGFLTVLLAIWLWKREERKWVRNLGFIALAAVITQGVLGGLTVRFMLPTAISVSHATLAQTFFAITVSIALFTSSWWREDQTRLREQNNKFPVTTLSILMTVGIFVQLILGAVMRHTHSGLAVPDVPFAYGQVFPSLSPEALAQYNQQLILDDIRLSADGPITSFQIVIHLLHRYWGVVVGIITLWTAVRFVSLKSVSRRLSTLGSILAFVVLLQIGLGVLTVLSVKAVDITTAHVATGAFLLACAVLSTLHALKLYGLRERRPSVRFSSQEVTA
jgi:cytochrome c oxidase assembly protein subunit 15